MSGRSTRHLRRLLRCQSQPSTVAQGKAMVRQLLEQQAMVPQHLSHNLQKVLHALEDLETAAAGSLPPNRADEEQAALLLLQQQQEPLLLDLMPSGGLLLGQGEEPQEQGDALQGGGTATAEGGQDGAAKVGVRACQEAGPARSFAEPHQDHRVLTCAASVCCVRAQDNPITDNKKDKGSKKRKKEAAVDGGAAAAAGQAAEAGGGGSGKPPPAATTDSGSNKKQKKQKKQKK